jgi:hypothetical protein
MVWIILVFELNALARRIRTDGRQVIENIVRNELLVDIRFDHVTKHHINGTHCG